MRRLFSTAGLGAGILALSSCGLLGGGVYEMPLPGGADLGDDPISISADFEDALDRVPQSTVKVDNVPVGRVSRITINDVGPSDRSAESRVGNKWVCTCGYGWCATY